jgi:hypothetical protein
MDSNPPEQLWLHAYSGKEHGLTIVDLCRSATGARLRLASVQMASLNQQKTALCPHSAAVGVTHVN